MEKRMARFRRQVEAHFGGRPGRGARYSLAFRASAVEVASACLACGGLLGPGCHRARARLRRHLTMATRGHAPIAIDGRQTSHGKVETIVDRLSRGAHVVFDGCQGGV